jgi:predicted SnoaL-like aldol condensation-catalyzing enzyme
MQTASKEKADNRQTAVSFLELASSGKLDEAYRKVSANFRHHNAYFTGDTKSLKAGMADAHKKFPNTRLEVQRTIAEGDLVAVHSRVHHGPETAPIAVVHIFRFAGNEIAELWDVGMEVPKDSPNENGVF